MKVFSFFMLQTLTPGKYNENRWVIKMGLNGWIQWKLIRLIQIVYSRGKPRLMLLGGFFGRVWSEEEYGQGNSEKPIMDLRSFDVEDPYQGKKLIQVGIGTWDKSE